MKIEKDILQRYASGQCTVEESDLVEAWFEEVDSDTRISDEMLDAMVARLDKKIVPNSGKSDRMIWTSLAAACLCAVIGFVIYRYSAGPSSQVHAIADISDIKAPTTSQAFLLLQDNKSYNLDNVQVGDTLRAEGYALTRSATGELQYVDMLETAQAAYHTLRTKSGRGVSIKLSDGSSVWLNANSEIRYPVRFAAVREVKLSGEAYFEVAKAAQGNVSTPFFVRGDRQTIQVFGTKFNANYQDNSIALLAGKIALSNQGSALESKESVPQAVLMQPGQVYIDGKLVSDPNIGRHIDWKEGYFDVEGISLGEFSKELSNWYGIDIEVADELKDKLLLGHINRQKDLVDVLDIVAKAFPISYKLENNKVMITER